MWGERERERERERGQSLSPLPSASLCAAAAGGAPDMIELYGGRAPWGAVGRRGPAVPGRGGAPPPDSRQSSSRRLAAGREVGRVAEGR